MLRNPSALAFFFVLFIAPHGAASAAACRDILVLDDHELTQDEMRACLEPRAKAMVALHLLGERELTWKNFAELNHKCNASGREELSSDPIEWASQVASCPSPKSRCGCPPDTSLGTRFMPEEAEAEGMRATNLRLIKQEAAIITKAVIAQCEDIRTRLQGMNGVKVKRKCNSLR